MPASITQILKDKKNGCEGVNGRRAPWLARRYASWLAPSSGKSSSVVFDNIKK
jgi:hypothetical protein